MWAGLVVAVTTFILGGADSLALAVLDLGDSVSCGAAGIISGLIGFAAFFSVG